MKIDIIIWSKNRSCQLDLLLRSINKYFKNAGDVYVLVKATDKKYLDGYLKLAEIHDRVKYLIQDDFNSDIKHILKNMQTDYILGISDDNIFIDNVFLTTSISHVMLDYDQVALSLRLGKNVNFCQPANLCMETPEYKVIDDYLLEWDWTKIDPRGCWGYPHPVDSNIYERNYITNLLNEGHYNNPCEMENHINSKRPADKPYMLCYETPKLISICANSNFGNLNSGITTEELNDKWLEGYQIKMPEIDPKSLKQCHIEYTYEMEKRND